MTTENNILDWEWRTVLFIRMDSGKGGEQCNAMRNIYVALVRSVIAYGSVVYQSAAKTLLNKWEVIQNKALRLSCGVCKGTR